MAGCVLRAKGNFAPDQFLAQHSFSEQVSHKKGSLVVTVSDADGNEFDTQISDALAFLQRRALPLDALRGFSGVEEISLNFGLWQVAAPIQIAAFPAHLVSAAGALGIGLASCFYALAEDDA